MKTNEMAWMKMLLHLHCKQIIPHGDLRGLGSDDVNTSFSKFTEQIIPVVRKKENDGYMQNDK